MSPRHASPDGIRQGLNVESGLNDGICVPLLFAAVALADVESEISGGRIAATASALDGPDFIAAFVAGYDLSAGARARPRADQRAQRAGGERAQRRHLRVLRGDSARARVR